jgi:S-adenosylmethionine:tRNA ribosyltransferase-isomerase
VVLRASDFDYALPPEQIAQAPLARRDRARLLVLDRAAGNAHRSVQDLPELLPAGALIVVNDTRVIRARLHGKKPTGGRVELLLVDPLPSPPDDGRERWRCIGGASKPIRPGPLALDGERAPGCEVLAVDGEYVEVAFTSSEGLLSAIERIGEVPLPPYIRRPDTRPEDAERYQTIFARTPGAVAAPTAGLHFTPELLAALEARGIRRATITLHVGPGTFAPLRSDDVTDHVLHAERYELPAATAQAIAATKAAGRPVVAVGTTVVRTLEATGGEAGAGSTRLFLKPGHQFRVVDQLVTNFHLPKSTLLMLVAAFAGRERVLAAYAEAVAAGYRFYSYGDAMLIR